MERTLAKGLQALELLARSGRAWGVTPLARALQLPKANVYRSLRTLLELGYVKQDENGEYRASLKLFELGSGVVNAIDVRQAALGPLNRLAEATHETTHLATRDGWDILYLVKIDSPQPVRAYSELGGRAPAHCVATGKALLAHAEPEHWPARLPRHTERTIVEPARLRTQLAEIRRIGYAINREEWRDGVGGVGAAILDRHGRPVAAVGMSVPIARFNATTARALGAQAAQSAASISSELGYCP